MGKKKRVNVTNHEQSNDMPLTTTRWTLPLQVHTGKKKQIDLLRLIK